MRAHMLVVAIAGLSIAAAAAAEPVKAPIRKAEQPSDKAATTVVAAAAVSEAPAEVASEQQAPAQAKQRRGRVTSCRCGDQNPSD